MNPRDTDSALTNSIPQLYERHLVPLIFEPYAIDLASRVALRRPSSVLEVGAGTGVVTRHLAKALAPASLIVATDLNQPMLDTAAETGTIRPVEWRQADAQQLPFPDATFDVVQGADPSLPALGETAGRSANRLSGPDEPSMHRARCAVHRRDSLFSP